MIDNNKTALIELIKSSLFGTVPCFPADTDWGEVYKEAIFQAVVALAMPAVPADKAAIWQEPAAQSTAHYMRALFEQSNLIKLFSDNNIPLVIIKGTAAAMYYPKPQLRTMGDIDFLVSEKDFEAARTLLEKSGYTFLCDYADNRDYTYKKGGVTFELHRKYSDHRVNIEPQIKAGIENAVIHSLNGYNFPTLPDFENGLVLLDHIRHHLYGGLGLRQIIDWCMFAGSMLDDNNYSEKFLPLIEKPGLVTFCETVTKMCKMYLGLPNSITWCDKADGDTAADLLQTVFKSGNFGVKNPYEYRPVRELAATVKEEGFFRILQTAGVANFGICRKYGFFRAFAWLFQLFRFARRGIAAIFRGQNFKKDIKEGKQKSDLNERLGI